MFDTAADGLGPAPDVRDIMADRFGPEMSGECAITGASGRFMKEHGRSFRQGIRKDGLDIVG